MVLVVVLVVGLKGRGRKGREEEGVRMEGRTKREGVVRRERVRREGRGGDVEKGGEGGERRADLDLLLLAVEFGVPGKLPSIGWWCGQCVVGRQAAQSRRARRGIWGRLWASLAMIDMLARW